MIKALLLRRYWLLKHRFFSTITFIILSPIIFHFSITKVMENILPISSINIPYEVWVFPAIIFFIASSSTFAIIYRDFFDLRIFSVSELPASGRPRSFKVLLESPHSSANIAIGMELLSAHLSAI